MRPDQLKLRALTQPKCCRLKTGMSGACGMLALLLLLAGCSANRHVDTLEAQLRHQESEINRLTGALNRVEAELMATREDSQALRTQLTGAGQQVIPPEQAELFYRVTGVQIDKLQTSYLQGEQGESGRLAVMVTPVDQFQTALRVPGEITIKLRPTETEGQAALLHQTFHAREVQQLWTAGWVSSGYLLQIPWDTEHAGDTAADQPMQAVSLEATFRTFDGRQFSTQLEFALPPGRNPTEIAAGEPEQLEQPERRVPVPIEPVVFEPVRPPSGFPRTDTSDRRTIEEFPVYR